MFVHFDLPCDGDMQQRLHRVFRHKIREWKEAGFVSRAVLTYHFPKGSLYVCLDLPALKVSAKRKVNLSSEEVNKIPKSITNSINYVCKENGIELRIMDYETQIDQAKKRSEKGGSTYYDGAPVEEILRFASLGTQIALAVLHILENDEERWHNDTELTNFIFSQLKEELGTDYEWINWALHFVCNPLMISEHAIIYPISNRVLKTLKMKL